MFWKAYNWIARPICHILRKLPAHSSRLFNFAIRVPKAQKNWVWFHGASVGEIEALLPLVERCAKAEIPFVLTGFSRSLGKFFDTFQFKENSNCLFYGFSPNEGEWDRAFQHSSPSIFITYRYEFWPELMQTLQKNRIHLVVVGAKWRKSLGTLRWILTFLGMMTRSTDQCDDPHKKTYSKEPSNKKASSKTGRNFKISLMPAMESETAAILKHFGGGVSSEIRVEIKGEIKSNCFLTNKIWMKRFNKLIHVESIFGDPRWTRVRDRARSRSSNSTDVNFKNKRESLQKWQKQQPKTTYEWAGVLGSVWESDAPLISEYFSQSTKKSHLFIAPHEVSQKSIQFWSEWSRVRGLNVVIWSQWLQSHVSKNEASKGTSTIEATQGTTVWMIDSVGWLADLYSIVDWAYIGGGFGKGVHSTIEPAWYQIPILCGSAGIDRFSEISILKARNQLVVVNTSEEFARALKNIQISQNLRDTWANQNEQLAQDSDHIWKFISTLYYDLGVLNE